MKLDDETQQAIRLAVESHRYCIHDSAVLCHALILSELGMRRGYPVAEEEIEACGFFIADVTLENLILKGLIEVSGVSEDGDMLVGLTEAGYTAIEDEEKEGESMALEDLVAEWNWDFDPYDQQTLDFATNEMVGFLREMEPDYLVDLLRPFVERKIFEDLMLKTLREEDEEDGID
jgi:hypothetical protein